MAADYYAFPLRCDLLIQGSVARQSVNTVKLYDTLEDSLNKHVYLLVTTPFRSVRFDPDYGCSIWEDDFSAGNDLNDREWTYRIETSVHKAIIDYERRLERVEVIVELDRGGAKDHHKRLLVTVTAEISKSNHRPFVFKHGILVAPFIARTT